MSNQFEKIGLSGKMGGLAVKGMIETVEQKMAAGEKVSAAPSSKDEAELLQQVKRENAESAQRAQNHTGIQ